MGCKRVVFSNDWYPALARPDVELVTERIERIVPDGVVTADGTTRVADVIIYGTGFKAAEFLAPMLVSGLGGWRLQQAWQDGPRSYLGITVSGFPNFFMLYGPNTNLGGNSIIYMLEGQIGYVLGAIQSLQAERLAWPCRCATQGRNARPAASCCRRGSISAATAGLPQTWCAATSCSTQTGSTPAPAPTPTHPPGPTTWSPRCATRTPGCRRC